MNNIASKDSRINREITGDKCRLIGVDGSQLGIFSISDALRIAEDQGFDLVEIAPNADPPVCRVMDYGKYKFDQEIKAKQAKKNQAKLEIKEMKFRPKIGDGDYETKKKHVIRFLNSGAKVKVTIMFRGREMAHPELGQVILDRLAEELADIATVENKPKVEGRNMHMMLAPISKKSGKKAKQEKAEESKNA